ncbi:flavin monoamine oxidase family protein [Edaphobacter albus]|uniref:flavin monoamine oxidase family protein n=1 Tax=Edaphobacter sp. 4G125 TaxID=2763071 RepID=UPI001645FAD1|nr:FAD-dependent oxidoreductase [Edaphobacter sp. 4G125]QNI36221.1 FAD-dependent oxidoreductase [Edaphobacter sp. 4G125]
MGITRRDFLMRVGQAGGYSAAFTTMQSLGLLPMKALAAEPITAAAGIGKGVKIVVLGGGVSGLVTAYEAKKLGYEVKLLEARHRPGGRAWSARKGDVVEFIDGTEQHITWSDGLYQNMGPARLPSVHGTMLGYCRELKVPLEVEVNTSRSALLQNDKVRDGKAIQQRKAINDTRGQVSELLSKALAGGALDQELSTEDRQRMLEALKIYGPLNTDGKYIGSDRSEIKQYPGAGPQKLIFDDHPLKMQELLDANFWNAELYEEAWDWQATMFQPINGMQQISNAFAKALGSTVVYNAPVTEIAKTAKGVRVGYGNSSTKYIEADYAVCAMPLSILMKIKADLDPAHRGAVDRGGASYRGAFKIPWESRRFWEQDYNIYGGLSFLAEGPSPVWYPSCKLFSDRGIVVSGYMDETMMNGFDKLSLEQKFEASRTSIEKLHPGHGKELEKPIFCGWKHIKWNEGSWIGRIDDADYDTITQPDGPIYFTGDHTSHIVGWQEGAALSGKRAVQMISDRVKAARLEGKHSETYSA